jgi:hypothetical protein
MPGGDRTGPQGAGSRTGRGMGYCSGYNWHGFANQAAMFQGGFGFGRGGAGCGWRHRFYATSVPGWVTPIPEQGIADLNGQADLLKA